MQRSAESASLRIEPSISAVSKTAGWGQERLRFPSQTCSSNVVRSLKTERFEKTSFRNLRFSSWGTAMRWRWCFQMVGNKSGSASISHRRNPRFKPYNCPCKTAMLARCVLRFALLGFLGWWLCLAAAVRVVEEAPAQFFRLRRPRRERRSSRSTLPPERLQSLRWKRAPRSRPCWADRL